MIGDNIRALRENAGLSQTQLADKLHVVRQTVSKWEQGKSVPDAQMCKELARAFGIPVSDLFSEEPPSSEPDDIAIQLSLINEKLHTLDEHRKFWEGVVCRAILVALGLPVFGWFLVTFINPFLD